MDKSKTPQKRKRGRPRLYPNPRPFEGGEAWLRGQLAGLKVPVDPQTYKRMITPIMSAFTAVLDRGYLEELEALAAALRRLDPEAYMDGVRTYRSEEG